MNSAVLYLITNIVRLLPETRCFSFKRTLYRLAGICLGKEVRICSSATFLGSGQISVGDNTWIGHQVLIVASTDITIGENVDIAPRVYIGTGEHLIDKEGERSAGKGVSRKVVIEDGVWICANASIYPGVTVGKKAVIAANAVVLGDIEAYALSGGCPARKIKDIRDK